jgi:hypothetical protein
MLLAREPSSDQLCPFSSNRKFRADKRVHLGALKVSFSENRWWSKTARRLITCSGAGKHSEGRRANQFASSRIAVRASCRHEAAREVSRFAGGANEAPR